MGKSESNLFTDRDLCDKENERIIKEVDNSSF